MASPTFIVRRAVRFLLVALLVVIAAGQVHVTDAAVTYAISGNHGASRVLDDATNPGAVCYYDAGGKLFRIRVDRPYIWAYSGYGAQPVSFRARDQWLLADGRQDLVASGNAVYRYSPTKQATVNQSATFDGLDILFQVAPGATGKAFVDLSLRWHNPRTGAVEAGRGLYLSSYRLVQVRADGSSILKGSATGTCSARLG